MASHSRLSRWGRSSLDYVPAVKEVKGGLVLGPDYGKVKIANLKDRDCRRNEFGITGTCGRKRNVEGRHSSDY